MVGTSCSPERTADVWLGHVESVTIGPEDSDECDCRLLANRTATAHPRTGLRDGRFLVDGVACYSSNCKFLLMTTRHSRAGDPTRPDSEDAMQRLAIATIARRRSTAPHSTATADLPNRLRSSVAFAPSGGERSWSDREPRETNEVSLPVSSRAKRARARSTSVSECSGVLTSRASLPRLAPRASSARPRNRL
jgi:hypothetical protein